MNFCEKDENILRRLSRLASDANYTVFAASNLEDAEIYIAEQLPQIAIIDLRLKEQSDEQDLSGLQLARSALKAGAAVLLISNYGGRLEADAQYLPTKSSISILDAKNLDFDNQLLEFIAVATNRLQGDSSTDAPPPKGKRKGK